MLSPVSNTVILQHFDTFGWTTRMVSGLQKFCCSISQKFYFFWDFTNLEQLWRNGPVKQNQVCVCVCACVCFTYLHTCVF